MCLDLYCLEEISLFILDSIAVCSEGVVNCTCGKVLTQSQCFVEITYVPLKVTVSEE